MRACHCIPPGLNRDDATQADMFAVLVLQATSLVLDGSGLLSELWNQTGRSGPNQLLNRLNSIFPQLRLTRLSSARPE